jgi:hypothetical protein
MACSPTWPAAVAIHSTVLRAVIEAGPVRAVGITLVGRR